MSQSQVRQQRRARERAIDRVSSTFGDKLVEVPKRNWPQPIEGMTRLFRNRDFMVWEFAPHEGVAGMVAARVLVGGIALDAKFTDAIPHSALEDLKNQLGYGLHQAVEVYRREANKVARIEHRELWILRGLLPFDGR